MIFLISIFFWIVYENRNLGWLGNYTLARQKLFLAIKFYNQQYQDTRQPYKKTLENIIRTLCSIQKLWHMRRKTEQNLFYSKRMSFMLILCVFFVLYVAWMYNFLIVSKLYFTYKTWTASDKCQKGLANKTEKALCEMLRTYMSVTLKFSRK